LRQELGVDDRFVVLYHGEVSPNRGLDIAIQAFALLSRRCLEPAPLLAVLGDGVARASLEELAATLEAPVRFLGRVPYDDVPAYVVMSDVALMALPDHSDWRYQFPLKFAECMASGTPAIVSEIPAFTELAGNSPAVVYVREVTPEAIAEKVEHCIEHRDDLLAWGSAGKALAEEHSWRRVAQRLVSYLADT
jgi:glycosyltransferase involved in cell wall biosynthesis